MKIRNKLKIKSLRINLRLFCFLLLLSCASSGKIINEKGITQNNLRKHYDFVNKALNNSCPSKILLEIDYSDFGFSHFKTKENKVFIARKRLEKDFDKSFVHELTHICLYHKTKGQSTKEKFRFFDEGFADIVSNRFISNEKKYKERALQKAHELLLENKVHFKNIQKWSSYFGIPPKVDYRSYNVGSTFIYFILDNYGSKYLDNFFESIRATGNLKTTIKNTFSINLDNFEQNWIKYIKSKS